MHIWAQSTFMLQYFSLEIHIQSDSRDIKFGEHLKVKVSHLLHDVDYNINEKQKISRSQYFIINKCKGLERFRYTYQELRSTYVALHHYFVAVC